MRNTTIRLANRPAREIENHNFIVAHEPIPPLQEGEISVAVEYISIDPAMRTWLADIVSYMPPVMPGEVMRAGGLGKVIASSNPAYAIGDVLQGPFGVQTIYTGPPLRITTIDPDFAAPRHYLGGLGGTGLAAYFGLLKVGALTSGDTVVVSAAAGAVGHVVVQMAKLKGHRVIGIAGGAAKCARVIAQYGADACIDYKHDPVAAKLRALCPGGIDLYFDNVGGTVLEAVLDTLAMNARIVISGAISEYNNIERVRAPRNYLNLIGKGARMQGLLNMHWVSEYESARLEMITWMRNGQLILDEHIEEGIENFPTVLRMLFEGRNQGKLLLKV